MHLSSDADLLLTITLLVIAVVFLVAITPSPQDRASWQVRELAANKDSVVTAAVSYLQDAGYAIDTIDRDSGFVKTQYASRAQLEGGWGIITDILVGEARYAATVQVSQSSLGNSVVRVNLIAEKWNEGSLFKTGHWSQDPLAYDKSNYDTFFRGLQRKLQLGMQGTRIEQYALAPGSLIWPYNACV